ncbi:uncharacterized protein LOC110852065 [Folsomia candida]|uniref:Uncharacterized protein n=1 Tax=Folsomia candida TaxID=158441 RepID=A0A226E4D1_FOLCA|nr:uncharacterized protein LOC110852065 [Folsomia candida]OXA52130.1 hypothetical protein Fcan01_13802 [Folsomia candida]
MIQNLSGSEELVRKRSYSSNFESVMNNKIKHVVLFPFLTQIIGCTSVFLATSTFIISICIFTTHQYSDVGHVEKCHQVFLNASGSHEVLQIARCKVFLEKFISILTTSSIICGIMASIQFVLTAYLLLAENFETFTYRARKWIFLNIGAILVYVICFTAIWTLPTPPSLAGYKVRILAMVKFLPGFSTILMCNLLFGGVLVLIVLLMFRYASKTLETSKLNYSSLFTVHHL